MDPRQLVDLGFAETRVPQGTHICQVYGAGEERDSALLGFLFSGLRSGETTACFGHRLDPTLVEGGLEKHGFSFSQEQAERRLFLQEAEEVYFAGDRFDPERMLDLLARFHRDSCAAGRPGARVIGEMSPRINQVPGGSRLLQYERQVNQFLTAHPVTAVCQYDVRSFDGATIMDVLSVHPMMVVRGAVIHNPFFVPPKVSTQ